MTRLYSIGDVHEMTGLSVSALRYYADMKVVCPVRIDRQTGYRYYDFDDIQRLKTVGYLKKAGFSLAEITVVMEAASEEERRLLMSERMEQTQKQMKRLKERMSMMEWLTSQNPAPEAGHESYRIHQKQMDSRRVWMTETAKPCEVEDFYRQTGVLMAEEMADFQKMRGYLAVTYWKKLHLWREKSWPLKAALSQAEIVFLLRRTSLSCRRAIISV